MVTLGIVFRITKINSLQMRKTTKSEELTLGDPRPLDL